MKSLRKLIKDSNFAPTWPVVWLYGSYPQHIIHKSALHYDSIIATQKYISFLDRVGTQIEANIR